jgi:hypothetical protein
METPNVTLDRNDPQFSLGAQIGVLYGILAAAPDHEVECFVDADNIENVLRVAHVLGRKFHTTAECPGGCHLEFHFDARDSIDA